MRTHEIEAWALRAIEQVDQRQPNEDSRVELKAEWPQDPERAARRIAGHANALRGEPILWIIGVDEDSGVKGASQNDLSTWWAQTQAKFEGPVPRLRDVLVYWSGKTAVALYFETEHVPYVVKNPSHGKQHGGPVQLEVPWRDGTAVRSATHSDLVQLLSPLQRPLLKIEVGNGRSFVNEYPLPQLVGTTATVQLYTLKNEPNRTMHSPPRPTATRYLRVKVVNRGRRTARDCKGYLAAMQVERGGTFCDTTYADFMRLVWSHHPNSPSLDLLPEVPHWLDVASTLEHENRFYVETDPKTTRYSEGFAETSTYRLDIMVFAEDTDPAQTSLYLRWNGQWNTFDVYGEHDRETRQSC